MRAVRNKMLMLGVLSCGAFGSAQAGLIGVFDGNDKPANVKTALGGMDIVLYEKLECGIAFMPGSLTGANGCQGKTGEWWSSAPIDFLTVKASNHFALYDFSVPTNAGSWSTLAIYDTSKKGKVIYHDVSHISFWSKVNVPVSMPPVVPQEPPVVEPEPPVIVQFPPVFIPEPPVVPQETPAIEPPVHVPQPPAYVANVPEPGTILLMGLGLLGMGLAGRKHKK